MKVVVGGCSVSDYTGLGTKQTYGEILAQNIDAEYIHHGAGMGSNYRIWRNITNLVMNNEITEDFLIYKIANCSKNLGNSDAMQTVLEPVRFAHERRASSLHS